MNEGATTLQQVIDFLGELAPLELAEDWDNVGLLIGDPLRDVTQIITCLTMTSDVADEAVEAGAQLVVSHHPLLFRPVQQVTTATEEGRVLLRLIAGGVAVYSPHTAFDSAAEGINQLLAERLGLQDVAPLRPYLPVTGEGGRPCSAGGGRYGRLATPLGLSDFCERVKQQLAAASVQYVGDPNREISRVAVACGSAAEFLADAARLHCDVLLTGEARFHACLEARDLGIAMVLPGHYATERPGVEQLALTLGYRFPALTVWASRCESDPLAWSGS